MRTPTPVQTARITSFTAAGALATGMSGPELDARLAEGEEIARAVLTPKVPRAWFIASIATCLLLAGVAVVRPVPEPEQSLDQERLEALEAQLDDAQFELEKMQRVILRLTDTQEAIFND